MTPDDDNDGVPLVQYGPYGGKRKIPVHHDYVPLVVARTWNYHDDPTHIAFTTLRAEQLLAVERLRVIDPHSREVLRAISDAIHDRTQYDLRATPTEIAHNVVAHLQALATLPPGTPDDDNDGVECVGGRYEPEGGEPGGLLITNGLLPPSWSTTPYLAFTTLRAEQLLAIEKAARNVRSEDAYHDPDAAADAVCELHRALDTLRPAAPGTPE